MARSEVNFIYDAETAFRAPGATELTTTTARVGAVALDKLVNVRPSSQKNTLGAETYTIVIAVEEAAVDGDQTYSFDVTVGAAGAAATDVASLAVASSGQYVLILDSATIEKLDEDREELALGLTVAGVDPGSIKFAAWVV